MKKVLIIGATGSLAKYVIEAVKPLENIEPYLQEIKTGFQKNFQTTVKFSKETL